MVKQNFTWDGEKIRTSYEDEKHTPKDIINGLAGVNGQLNQMNGQKTQLEQQMKQLDGQIKSATEHRDKLKPFEEKCIELQKEKLINIINSIHGKCVKDALESSRVTVAKDPNAYDEKQVESLKYLDYQKLLATNEKVANKISSQIVSKYLYQEPIFENPFKD